MDFRTSRDKLCIYTSTSCDMFAKIIMENVTIIGAGLTGAVTAALVRKELPKPCTISLLDSGGGAGGRMATSLGTSEYKCSVDLGAQYISASPHYYNAHSSFYTELERDGLLKPLTGLIEGDIRFSRDKKNLIAPSGLGSVVKHYISKSGASPEFNHHVSSCEIHNGRWRLTSTDGVTSEADALVLTMPVPQILELQGTIKSIVDNSPDVRRKLEAVSYSSRFALGLFYKPGTSIDVPWCAKYISDSVVCFVAIDTKKREQTSGGSSVVVHASVPFSLPRLKEDADAICTDLLLPRVRQLLPGLPRPDAVMSHKWRFSQVYQGYAGTPSALLLQADPPLILAGDAFAESPCFDGCILSATTAVGLLKQTRKV